MRSPGPCDNFDLTRNTLLHACEVTLKTSECALSATSETRLSQAKSTSSTTEGILLVKGSPPDRTRAHLYHPNSDDRPAVRATPAFDPLSRADFCWLHSHAGLRQDICANKIMAIKLSCTVTTLLSFPP
jgi:hypothetical protein